MEGRKMNFIPQLKPNTLSAGSTSIGSKVTIIQPTKRSVRNSNVLKEEKSLRVAAYCRVSTDDESQESSFSIQTSYYTKMIEEHEGWELAGIFADKAISGTSRKRRQSFNEMIAKAEAGQIDYIITKSLSRFARNTVDTLDCVRQLKQLTPPVGVYFEKENLDTLNAQGELILTILSAIAQEESRSISENIRWAIWKRFESGNPMVDLNRMLGYEKGENGEWLIHEEQAEIVRFIFSEYLRGQSANSIARQLNEEERRTVLGNLWRADGVLNILRNEKYVGDVHMQKTYTKDFLTHEAAINEGQTRSFYIKDHHTAIVSREDWNQVQEILEYRRKKRETPVEKTSKKERSLGVFRNLYCGCCQGKMQRCDYSAVARNYQDERSMTKEELESGQFSEKYKFNYSLYRCKTKYAKKDAERSEKGKGRLTEAKRAELEQKCKSHTVMGCAVEQSFMEMLYAYRQDYLKLGEESELVKKFAVVYEEILQKQEINGYALEQIALADVKIRELEKSYEETMQKLHEANLELQRARMLYSMNPSWAMQKGDAMDSTEIEIYTQMAEDLKFRIEEQQRKKQENEQALSEAETKKENFQSFLYYLKQLPDTNRLGQNLVICGVDIKSGRKIRPKKSKYNKRSVMVQEAVSDYLDMDRNIYERFIEKGIVKGDMIVYQTSFGLNLSSKGNLRTLESFVGYRRCMEDGTSLRMKETWEVNNRAIQYKRTERKHIQKGKVR